MLLFWIYNIHVLTFCVKEGHKGEIEETDAQTLLSCSAEPVEDVEGRG